MILVAAALAALLVTCAPESDPRTEASLVAVESGGEVWALHDNTTGASYSPASYVEAVVTANALIARGHLVDVGIAQVDSANFPALGVDAAAMLRPCRNLSVSSRMLNRAYREQYDAVGGAEFIREQRALRRAYSVYNSNSAFGSPAYVERILEAATSRYVLDTAAIARELRANRSSRRQSFRRVAAPNAYQPNYVKFSSERADRQWLGRKEAAASLSGELSCRRR